MKVLLDLFLMESPPLDSSFSWLIAIRGCLYLAFNMGFYTTSGALYVIIQERYQVSKENASYPVNAFSVTLGIVGAISGPVHHRLKTRKTLVLAAILGVIGSCLSVFNPLNDPITWLTICMTIRGIGFGLNLPPILQVVSTHFEKHRAMAFMIVFSNVTVAGLALPSIVRLSAEEYGLDSSWLIHAAIHCQTLLLAITIKPRPINVKPPNLSIVVAENEENLVRRSRNDEEYETFLRVTKNDQEAPTKTEEGLWTILSSIFRDKTFYVMCLFHTMVTTTNIAFRTTIVDYGIDTNLDPDLNKYILEIISLGELIKIPTAILIDSGLCFVETLAASATVLTALTLLLLTVTSNWVYVVVSILYFGCYAVNISSLGPIYATLGTSRLAVAFGLGMACFGLTLVVLPSLIGLFRDRYGTYDYLYYLFSLVNVIVAIFIGWSRKKRWFKREK